MQINTTFDNNVNSFIVRMPEEITFEALKLWEEEFLKSVSKRGKNKNISLLIDTNKHKFKSIECLKLLRNILSSADIKCCFSKFAFIQPKQYREPNIDSSKEGYFINFENAYCWLQDKETYKLEQNGKEKICKN